jgi:hypothetical protein
MSKRLSPNVRPVRVTRPADLAAVLKLPEPPADPAHAMAGWERQVRRAASCASPVRLRGTVEHADPATGEAREATPPSIRRTVHLLVERQGPGDAGKRQGVGPHRGHGSTVHSRQQRSFTVD